MALTLYLIAAMYAERFGVLVQSKADVFCAALGMIWAIAFDVLFLLALAAHR